MTSATTTRPRQEGRLRRRAAGAALGLLIDRVLGEPQTRLHPVVGFGAVMGRAERLVWADRLGAGAGYAALGVLLGVSAGRLVRSVPVAVALAVAGRSLRESAAEVELSLTRDDLAAARAGVTALVGRDPSELDASGVSAAVIESLAENSVDAVVAPVFWSIVAGAPGALGYRAVNTMDAMVGRRDARYGRFGTAAARLDDVANYVPARLYAGLVCLARPRSLRSVLRTVRRDSGAHPSPNSGVAEAAAAAALERQLGGPLRYGSRREVRPFLGTGPRAVPADIARARRLTDHVELALVALLVLAALRPAREPAVTTARRIR